MHVHHRKTKKIPIDLGQGHFRHTTKAKIAAYKLTLSGSGNKALDIGCGDGYWSKKLITKGWNVTSIDKSISTYIPTIKSNIEQGLPFDSNSFDLVWASEVIEHITDLDLAITEINRVLKPGGMAIITTPNSHFWIFHLLSLFGIKPSEIQNPDHKHFFSYEDIRKLFPNAEIYGFFPYYLIKITIRHNIGLLSPTFIIKYIK